MKQAIITISIEVICSDSIRNKDIIDYYTTLLSKSPNNNKENILDSQVVGFGLNHVEKFEEISKEKFH